MVTQPNVLSAVRNAEFVLFPYPQSERGLDPLSQLSTMIDHILDGDKVFDALDYARGKAEALPRGMFPKERLYFRQMKRGVISILFG